MFYIYNWIRIRYKDLYIQILGSEIKNGQNKLTGTGLSGMPSLILWYENRERNRLIRSLNIRSNLEN